MTPTGGLHGTGLPVPTTLRVGTQSGSADGIHEMAGFSTSAFHMPGGIVPAEDGQGSDDPGEPPVSYNPARSLMSPLDPATLAPLHPGGLGFLAGLGDYAGVNFRQFAGLQVDSTIGGGTVSYDAAPWVRGHCRASGFTGIVQSDPRLDPAADHRLRLRRAARQPRLELPL